MSFDHQRYDDIDSGACYACGMTWLAGEGERHRRGCYRIEHPAGTPPEGQCPECGTLPTPDQVDRGVSYTTSHCPNEGGCSRWRDPVDDYQDDDEEPIPHGELVAARREAAAAEGDLDDLPF